MPKSVREAAEEWVFETNGNKWSNNNGTAGDNFGSFLAGAEWMRKQFTLHGTTDCYDCQNGRATLYATLDGRCIGCTHKREETAK